MTAGYCPAPLNLIAPAVTHHKAVSGHEERMKIALLALLDLALEAPSATPKSPSNGSQCAVMTVK